MKVQRGKLARKSIESLLLSASMLSLLPLSSCRSITAPAPPQPAAASRPDTSRDGSRDAYAEARPGRRRSRRGNADRNADPGAFDFYLLNLSWSPEFCATHEASSECGHGLGLVVHGLWPQDLSGDYPEDCSDAPGPANPQTYTDLLPTASLVEHEWQTHGTCSGLAADAYFAEIRKAFSAVKVPADLGAGADADGVSPDQILNRFSRANPAFPPASFALSCGNNRLTAIEICLTKDLQPEACQGVRSCRATVIRVTPR